MQCRESGAGTKTWRRWKKKHKNLFFKTSQSQSHESLEPAIISGANVVAEEVLDICNVLATPRSKEEAWNPRLCDPGVRDPLVEVLPLQLAELLVHSLHK